MVDDARFPIRPDTHRFLVDLMLGTLVAYLRVCGYNTAYVGDRAIETDAEITDTANTEHRIVITRDTSLATQTTHALLLESQPIEQQLKELHTHGVLLKPTSTPTRCGTCNARLTSAVTHSSLPDYVPSCRPPGLWHCPKCGQYFWKGSHWDTMQNRINRATSQ
jgi:uncharacterized protein with PIN domain